MSSLSNLLELDIDYVWGFSDRRGVFHLLLEIALNLANWKFNGNETA